MVVVLPREELCPGLVRGCPLSLRQSRRRQRLEKRIDHVGRMDPPPPGPWCLWVGYPGSSATDRKRSHPSPSRAERTACFTQRHQDAMEENGRVTVKKVERPDGMTEYLLEYIPPIMIS